MPENRALGHVQGLSFPGADQLSSDFSRMRARLITLAEHFPALTVCSRKELILRRQEQSREFLSDQATSQ